MSNKKRSAEEISGEKDAKSSTTRPKQEAEEGASQFLVSLIQVKSPLTGESVQSKSVNKNEAFGILDSCFF
jgi:hypothetical protein